MTQKHLRLQRLRYHDVGGPTNFEIPAVPLQILDALLEPVILLLNMQHPHVKSIHDLLSAKALYLATTSVETSIFYPRLVLSRTPGNLIRMLLFVW